MMRFSLLTCLFGFFLFIGVAWGLDLPSSFDLRNIDGHSYIGPIRDQGACGSCYSFGALAAAESTWNRTHGRYDDQAIDLSEAFIVWSLSPLYDGFDGCGGANYDYEELTALTEYGVPLESVFPYVTADPGPDVHWDAARNSFLDWYRIPPNDIETTKRILYRIGAIDAAVLVDNAFAAYSGDIFENTNSTVRDTVPYYTATNHAIALVGWNDESADGGMGSWILRNSWGSEWGNGGYMNIRYTSAAVNLEGTYLITTPWEGANLAVENNQNLIAVPWIAGGTINAHGIDLWGSAAGSVLNRGTIAAESRGVDELATARGIYLWGGPAGQVINEGGIEGVASSDNQQAIAYAVCQQGGLLDNSGSMTALATAESDQAMAFGIWAANGGNPLEIHNSGEITARVWDSQRNIAYGVWGDSRKSVSIINSGTINAYAAHYAIGVLLSGGPALLSNSGVIEAKASYDDPDLEAGMSIGVRSLEEAVILNSGTISGAIASVYASGNTELILDTGSNLIGSVFLSGTSDLVGLLGTGSEETRFIGAENLMMMGEDWSLSGDSAFDSIQVMFGRLGVDGALAGQTTVLGGGILGGNGSLTGDVNSRGRVAPGASVGHLTIDGDFTQAADGTLEIEIGDGVADRLTVTGTAALAGTLLLLPDSYATGGSYTFLEAGSVIGGFNTLAGAAILSFDLQSAADSLSLEVTRNSYASLANSHNRDLAAVLDSERAAAESDFADLLDSLDLALSRDALNANLESLTPRIHGAASVLVLDEAQARLADLGRHLRQVDADAKPGTWTGWLELLGRDAGYRRDGAYDALQADLYGLMLGVERTAGGLTLGAAVAMAENRYEARHSRDDGESDSQQGYIYAAWRESGISGWHLNAVLGGGLVQLDADRSIPFASRTAKSDHDGTLYGAAIGGGYRLNLGNWILDPTAGLSFVHLREESFREKGADSADLKVGTRHNDSLRSLVGMRLSRPVDLSRWRLLPELRAEWRHEFDRQTEDLSATLAGGGGRFDTPGRDLASDNLLLGVSLGARLSERLQVGLGYNCDLQSSGGATSHALKLDIAANF
jgi:uncharacterized protein with beta-barrel porin domain